MNRKSSYNKNDEISSLCGLRRGGILVSFVHNLFVVHKKAAENMCKFYYLTIVIA